MPYYKICYSVVQVRKFAPHLHHTMKSFAILHNFIDNYNILIIFAIYQQTAKYQCIYKRHKIAIFKYCPGHQKPRQTKVRRGFSFSVSASCPHFQNSNNQLTNRKRILPILQRQISYSAKKDHHIEVNEIGKIYCFSKQHPSFCR